MQRRLGRLGLATSARAGFSISATGGLHPVGGVALLDGDRFYALTAAKEVGLGIFFAFTEAFAANSIAVDGRVVIVRVSPQTDVDDIIFPFSRSSALGADGCETEKKTKAKK